MLKKVLMLMLILVASMLGCSIFGVENQPDFGTTYNVERNKIGLPTIPSDWTLDSASSPNESTWYNPNWQDDYTNRVPVHSSKYIVVSFNKIVYETDEYYGRDDWDCEGGTCRDSLYITYCYQANTQCNENVGWQVIYQSQKTTGFGREFISLDGAKEILKEWGLRYP